MADEIKLNTSIQSTDIVFDCPNCGKNLAIDARGAGMDITCPDCQNTIQVPQASEEATDATAALTSQLEAAQAKIAALEKTQTELQMHLEQISTEWGVIQNALDRVMALMQDLRMR
jgi:predicted RNA-binding Zn-ribbon protein involved in translation (DUF1610 family)